MHVFFVMCFLTWGASADACSSRAQEPLPVRQRDQRTAVGRVRPAHRAYVSTRVYLCVSLCVRMCVNVHTQTPTYNQQYIDNTYTYTFTYTFTYT